MTWLAPWALAAGVLGMFGIVAAHLLSRQRPRALALATARFLPGGMLEATTVQRVPQDRWWMLLRLLIVALLTMGVAQPVLTGRTVPTRTVLLLDRRLPVAVQRAAVQTLRASDVVIAFDTVARLEPVSTVVVRQASRSSLSAALATLVRVRDSIAVGADEVRVTAISPFAAGSLDPATHRIRALLRDSIALVPVTLPAARAVARAPLTLRADRDDPIAATAMLLGDSVARVGTVIERRATLAPNDMAAAEGGVTVVHWPARITTRAPKLDGITIGSTTWIAPFERVPNAVPDGARAIGWWADGAPAVWRRDAGSGCLLTVHVALPAAGDHVLSLAAQAWLQALVTSCDPDAAVVRAAPAWFSPAVTGRPALVVQQLLSSPASPWLIVAALVLAAVEMALRAVRPS